MSELNVQVQRMYRFDTDRPLKAFADIVVNDVLLVKGLKVLQGKNGLFVCMPSEQGKDNVWYECVKCLTVETRDTISDEVLHAYYENNPETLQAERVQTSRNDFYVLCQEAYDAVEHITEIGKLTNVFMDKLYDLLEEQE